MQNEITIDLSAFTPMELSNIQAAASAKKMTLHEYLIFLLSGVATPEK